MNLTFPVVVLAAAIGGFISSGIYYTTLHDPLVKARPDSSILEASPWIYAVEFGRTLVIAAVVAQRGPRFAQEVDSSSPRDTFYTLMPGP